MELSDGRIADTCSRCQHPYVEIWSVEDEDWASLPEPWNGEGVLCLRCFCELGGRPIQGFTYLEINGCVFADRIGNGTREDPERTPLSPIYYIRLFNSSWTDDVDDCLVKGKDGPENGRPTSATDPEVIDE